MNRSAIHGELVMLLLHPVPPPTPKPIGVPSKNVPALDLGQKWKGEGVQRQRVRGPRKRHVCAVGVPAFIHGHTRIGHTYTTYMYNMPMFK